MEVGTESNDHSHSSELQYWAMLIFSYCQTVCEHPRLAEQMLLDKLSLLPFTCAKFWRANLGRLKSFQFLQTTALIKWLPSWG